MVKKYSLLKKLSSYSVLASAVIAVTNKTEGQIIHHDLNPNVIVPLHGAYLLDLNGDSTYDFELVVISSTGSNLLRYYIAGIYAFNGDGIEKDTARALPPSVPFAAPNMVKEAIDAGDDWQPVAADFDFCSLKSFKNKGIFAGQGDRYVGLKLIANGGYTYYGWIRVSLNALCDTLVIKDYAYNATAGSSITAGDTGTASSIAQLTEATVLEPCSPNPATTISNIIYSIPVYSSVAITLYDVMGRKIKTLFDNAAQSPGRHQIPVDVSMLSSGIYFYELTVNGQTYTQKLAVTH